MGGKKRAKQFFQKHTISACKKWEKIVGKKCENRFLYSHEYRDQKMRGKNARNNFFTSTRIVQAKNVGKKSSGKGGENVFYTHMNIVTKRWRKKTRETISPETHE